LAPSFVPPNNSLQKAPLEAPIPIEVPIKINRPHEFLITVCNEVAEN
jgi:hypothetical protein